MFALLIYMDYKLANWHQPGREARSVVMTPTRQLMPLSNHGDIQLINVLEKGLC